MYDITGIWTIAPRGKFSPAQGWGFGQGQDQFQGWGQPDYCLGEKLTPGQGQGLGQGQFCDWGQFSSEAIVLEPI